MIINAGMDTSFQSFRQDGQERNTSVVGNHVFWPDLKTGVRLEAFHLVEKMPLASDLLKIMLEEDNRRFLISFYC